MAAKVTQASAGIWIGARFSNLTQRTSALFKEVERVPGTQRVLIYDRQGATLAAWTTGNVARETFDRIGECVATMFAAFRGRTFHEIELRFADRLMYVRTLGNAFIVIVCTPHTNLALLRMTCNVAAAPFETDQELQKNLSPN